MKHTTLLAVLMTALAAPALAQQSATNVSPVLVAQASSDASLSDGEVRKVDMETKKITLRHGPIQNLDMPPMTMVFQVKDTTLLDKVKAGDKVKFRAEKISGAYVVTQIAAEK